MKIKVGNGMELIKMKYDLEMGVETPKTCAGGFLNFLPEACSSWL